MYTDHSVSGKRLGNVLSIGLNLSNDFLSYCENLPFTRLNFGQTPILLVALYCVSIISILMVWERRMTKGILFISAGVFLLLVHAIMYIRIFEKVGVLPFSMLTGDAILIRLPYDQEIYLIDTGGTIRPNKEEWQRKSMNFLSEMIF